MQWAHRKKEGGGKGGAGKAAEISIHLLREEGNRVTQLQLQFNDSCCTLSQNDEAGKCSHMLHLVLPACLYVCVCVCWCVYECHHHFHPEVI